MTSPGLGEAAELLAALRAAYGRGAGGKIAAQTGISERMQRHVLKGTKPGASYVATLRELRDRGTVAAPAPVRRQRVRAPGGETVQRTRSPVAPRPTPGRYGHSSAATDGGAGRIDTWTFPHTPGPDRGRAAVEIVQALRHAGDRQVSIVVKLRDPDTGHIYEQRRIAHGQRAASLLRSARAKSRETGGDRRKNETLAGGLFAVIADMFPNGSAGHLGENVVGLTLEA